MLMFIHEILGDRPSAPNIVITLGDGVGSNSIPNLEKFGNEARLVQKQIS